MKRADLFENDFLSLACCKTFLFVVMSKALIYAYCYIHTKTEGAVIYEYILSGF